MPRLLKISAKDRADLRRKYLAGQSAVELAASRADLGLTPDQIRRLAARSGWARLKGSAREVKARGAAEALELVRRKTAAGFERALTDIAAGVESDARWLRAKGRGMVEDAAGASSIQRAQNLLLSRALRLYGLDRPEAGGGAARASLSLYFGPTPPGAGVGVAAAVNVTGTAAEADGEAGLALDFDEGGTDDDDETDDDEQS